MNATLEDQINAFEPITLEGANSLARLQTRQDRKYLLSYSQGERLLQWWSKSAGAERGAQPRVVEHENLRSSHYASQYFDTEHLLCYRMSLQRSRQRFKVRARTYLDSDLTFMEVKRKSRLGTEKYRVSCAPSDAEPQSSSNVRFVEEHLPVGVAPQQLQPALGIHYLRTTIVESPLSTLDRDPAGMGPFRATLDRDLTWTSISGQTICSSPQLIVETKTGGGPSPLDRWLWSSGIRPMAVSKYAVGTALLNPNLPRGRWNRATGRLGSADRWRVDA